MTSSEFATFRFLGLLSLILEDMSSSKIRMVSFVGVLLPLRLDAEAVISLNACLEAPTFPLRLRLDFGVKNLVKDLGVIVGAFLGLLLL